MTSRIRDGKAAGYIIKLYKKIVNAPQMAAIQEAMFITWTNFDCMDVLPVSDFQNFSRSLAVNDLKEREKYDSRQKLFLYPVSAEQKLLSPDNGNLENFPLITLTVLDLKRPSGIDSESYKSKLCRCLEDCLAEEKDIKGQIYGCLSIYDYALVMRGNSYAKLEHALVSYRTELLKAGICIRRTYTITGMNLKHRSAWREDASLRVSIRLSCTSQVTNESLMKNDSIHTALKPGYQVYSVLGKYDYDIVGEIGDTDKFIELFLDEGVLSPTRTGIQKTNTRFMFHGEPQSSLLPDSSDAPLNTNTAEEKLDDFIQRCEKLNGLCPSIRESLLRLILRLFQASTTINDERMRNSLTDTLDCFLDFLYIHQSESDQQDNFAQMINCFNLLLDNRVTASMSDFETPQNVLRYSGANLKVLLAYATYVEKLLFILQFYKDQKGGHIRYVPLVTTDTGAKITATVFMSSCAKYRFLNINIPDDLLFDVQNVLPWLTHEVGHFIRAGWSRKKRNDAYFWSMSRVAAKMLDAYIANDYMPSSDASSMDTFLALPVPEGEEGTKFDQYRDFVCQYYQSILLRCTYDYNEKLQIPQSHTGILMDSLEDIAVILQKIYEEAMADIFMIHILGIDDLNEYLRIQYAYYEHINQSSGNLPLENISRIIAVSIIIKEWEQQDYEDIKEKFDRLYHENENTKMEPLLNQLKVYEDYYMIEPLVIFLRRVVGSGLECLLREDRISAICKHLREQYKNLRTDDFNTFLEFIDSENI